MIGIGVLLAVYFFVAVAVFYAAFSRLVLTTRASPVRTRLSLLAMVSVACGSILATFVYGYVPCRWHLALLVVLFAWHYLTKHQCRHSGSNKFEKSTKDEYPCQLIP